MSRSAEQQSHFLGCCTVRGPVVNGGDCRLTGLDEHCCFAYNDDWMEENVRQHCNSTVTLVRVDGDFNYAKCKITHVDAFKHDLTLAHISLATCEDIVCLSLIFLGNYNSTAP